MDKKKAIAVDMIRSRWRTRRIMAWLTLLFFFLTVLLGFFYVKADELDNFSTLYNIVAFFCTGILGSYFGFATWDDIKNGMVDARRESSRSASRRRPRVSSRSSEEENEDEEGIPPEDRR